jgi:hypothetical protein
MIDGLVAPLAVVCHDAGATNLILHWLDPQVMPVRAVMQGPAEHLWRSRFGDAGRVATVSQALDGAAMLLSGTGWASALEHVARVQAAARGMRSVAVVDHWVNYAARFERQGVRQLPDELWVADADALALAHRTFPALPVQLKPNHYLQAQVAEIGPGPDPARDHTVLVVLEPTRNDWGRGEPGEFQALNHLLDQADTVGLDGGQGRGRSMPMRLRLRPHPSDPAGKYDAWIAQQGQHHDVKLDDAPTLAAALSRVAWVAGCESMAMVVALAAGRRVICMLPPWAPACRLPQAGLRHLRDVVSA